MRLSSTVPPVAGGADASSARRVFGEQVSDGAVDETLEQIGADVAQVVVDHGAVHHGLDDLIQARSRIQIELKGGAGLLAESIESATAYPAPSRCELEAKGARWHGLLRPDSPWGSAFSSIGEPGRYHGGLSASMKRVQEPSRII